MLGLRHEAGVGGSTLPVWTCHNFKIDLSAENSYEMWQTLTPQEEG